MIAIVTIISMVWFSFSYLSHRSESPKITSPGGRACSPTLRRCMTWSGTGEFHGNFPWDFMGISYFLVVNMWLICGYYMVIIWLMMVNNNLAGGWALPPWKMMEFVRLDHHPNHPNHPNYWGKSKIFQTTNQDITGYITNHIVLGSWGDPLENHRTKWWAFQLAMCLIAAGEPLCESTRKKTNPCCGNISGSGQAASIPSGQVRKKHWGFQVCHLGFLLHQLMYF